MLRQLHITTDRQGLHEITHEVTTLVREHIADDGLCTLFLRHTSASLLIQENADRSARRDLENWMNRMVPEDDPLYTHVLEGPDDMPAHIKAMLTQSALSIPVASGRPVLGTWQGIFLWEHRNGLHQRTLTVHLQPDCSAASSAASRADP